MAQALQPLFPSNRLTVSNVLWVYHSCRCITHTLPKLSMFTHNNTAAHTQLNCFTLQRVPDGALLKPACDLCVLDSCYVQLKPLQVSRRCRSHSRLPCVTNMLASQVCAKLTACWAGDRLTCYLWCDNCCTGGGVDAQQACSPAPTCSIRVCHARTCHDTSS